MSTSESESDRNGSKFFKSQENIRVFWEFFNECHSSQFNWIEFPIAIRDIFVCSLILIEQYVNKVRS